MEKFSGDQTVVYHGDCLQILADEVPDESVDLIFADPPYNIGKSFGEFKDKWPSDEEYVEWCKEWLELCLSKLTATGSFYVMTSTQAMPYFDLFLRTRCTIQSRIVWHYDSSGVQARNMYGSMYEPILHCTKDPKNYVFNADEIKVEAKTGAIRKLIDYRKEVPAPYNTKKVPGNIGTFHVFAIEWTSTSSTQRRSLRHYSNGSFARAATKVIRFWIRSRVHSQRAASANDSDGRL